MKKRIQKFIQLFHSWDERLWGDDFVIAPKSKAEIKKTIEKGTVSLQVFGDGEFKGHNGEVGRYSGCFIAKGYNDFTNRFNT